MLLGVARATSKMITETRKCSDCISAFRPALRNPQMAVCGVCMGWCTLEILYSHHVVVVAVLPGIGHLAAFSGQWPDTSNRLQTTSHIHCQPPASLECS